MKRVFFFKGGKKTTGLNKKIKRSYILFVFHFYCNENIVVNDIKNVHNVCLLFIRNSIDYYVKDFESV